MEASTAPPPNPALAMVLFAELYSSRSVAEDTDTATQVSASRTDSSSAPAPAPGGDREEVSERTFDEAYRSLDPQLQSTAQDLKRDVCAAGSRSTASADVTTSSTMVGAVITKGDDVGTAAGDSARVSDYSAVLGDAKQFASSSAAAATAAAAAAVAAVTDVTPVDVSSSGGRGGSGGSGGAVACSAAVVMVVDRCESSTDSLGGRKQYADQDEHRNEKRNNRCHEAANGELQFRAAVKQGGRCSVSLTPATPVPPLVVPEKGDAEIKRRSSDVDNNGTQKKPVSLASNDDQVPAALCSKVSDGDKSSPPLASNVALGGKKHRGVDGDGSLVGDGGENKEVSPSKAPRPVGRVPAKAMDHDANEVGSEPTAAAAVWLRPPPKRETLGNGEIRI